jgi:hypothetical protein
MKPISTLVCLTTLLLLSARGFSRASAPLALVGTYAKVSFNVDGVGGQNRLMPRLELRADQTYRWGRESGTYRLRDGRLYFSGSYATWGPGYVDRDQRVQFQFAKGRKHSTVTMYRMDG